MKLLCQFFVLMFGIFVLQTRAYSEMWNDTIWSVSTQAKVSEHELNQLLAANAIFVLGEEHYNSVIQNAEAILIQDISKQSREGESIILGWEFLNTQDHLRIAESYERYSKGEISVEILLQQLFPTGAPPLEYAPILESLQQGGGSLIPINLSRSQKSPVTRGGIGALDPSLMPADYQRGGSAYFERFKEAMGPHPLPYPIENYFESQSLTDEVMATELLASPGKARRVLVAGSFHSDYLDGVVTSIKRRAGQFKILTIKFVDASFYSEAELIDLFQHVNWGPVANLVYVVNEPTSE